MSARNDGGAAFPRSAYGAHGCSDRAVGMSLRDYFAAKAMQTFLAGSVLPPGFDATQQLALVASRSYEAADAMLVAREVQP